MSLGDVFENPYYNKGLWVKGGFHCHTVNSDGGLSPEETVRTYREKGFNCLGITDHAHITPIENFSDEGFVGIDSTENGGDPDIIGIGVDEVLPKKLPLAERAQKLAEQGGFTIAAHPTYCAVTPDVYINCPGLHAMEIFNAYCDLAYTNGYATELWDMVLGSGKKIWGLATDDAHLNSKKRFYSDAGNAWIEILTKGFSRESIIESLKRGSFYSTQGPRFYDIEAQNSNISITCSPVAQVRWRTFGKRGYVHYPEGKSITKSVLPQWLKPRTFIRIELVDSDGKKAWSNPFWVKGD